MQLLFLLEQVVNGLVLGGYYLLIALGLSLIFSVGGVVNLAHGAFYAFGAYISVEIAKYLGFGAAVVLSPIAVALLRILWGAQPLSVSMPPEFKGSVIIGDFLFSRYRLLLLGVVALVLVGVW